MSDMTTGPMETGRDGKTDRAAFDKDRNKQEKKGDKDVEMTEKRTGKDDMKTKDTGTGRDRQTEKDEDEDEDPTEKTNKH